MSRIRIPVPPSPADYDVIVEAGALAQLPALVAEAAPAHRYAIITDATVAALHGERLLDALRDAGARASLHTFPAGEASKGREEWAALTDALLAEGFGRDGAIIGLGGGVAGDLAGFVAATFMRGVPFVQVPTSLLAMVDASVGGKTGVDTAAGKNLVGAFHFPRLVVIDPEVLRTLPLVEVRNGLAETVKHGAIADAMYLAEIEALAPRLLERDPDALTGLIRRSVEIKAGFVAADPREAGARQALNFGHTIGHAIETATGYALPHGYAVAIGMVVEAAAGEAAGITEAGTASELARVLERLGLPTAVPAGITTAEVLDLVVHDKKARAGRTRYTLLRRPGEVARTAAGAWTHTLDDGAIDAGLRHDVRERARGSGVSLTDIEV